MKAYTIVLTILLIALASPTRADDLSAAATAGSVANLQKMQQLFPQPPAAPQAAPPFLLQYETDPDDEGEIGSYQPNGRTVIASSPFFSNLGTNGRTCFTCHEPQNAWGLSNDSSTARFAANPNDPLFRLVDGATCPSDDVSNSAAAQQAYSLLINKGLIRISLQMQASMQFQIVDVRDAYGNCNTNPITGLTGAKSGFLSFYRRPLPSANLGYLSNIMWDTREPTLTHQAMDATLGHAQATQSPAAPLLNQIVQFEGCTNALTPQNCSSTPGGNGNNLGGGLFAAQADDASAGDLTANGATGGPQALYQNLGNFSEGINDPFGGNFNPAIFHTYDVWANLTGTDPQTQARLALYRGQQVFNTVQFQISGVPGINDVQGKPSITGTCGTCHNNPGVGNHSSNLTVDIGVTDASPPNLDVSGLPVFTVLCTSGQQFTVTDLGVAMITGQCADIGKTKIPVIRGIAGRSPYFHNGGAPEITNLIDFYDQRFNIGLTDQQKADLAVFLESL
jgi:cytochrome c peroxidase